MQVSSDEAAASSSTVFTRQTEISFSCPLFAVLKLLGTCQSAGFALTKACPPYLVSAQTLLQALLQTKKIANCAFANFVRSVSPGMVSCPSCCRGNMNQRLRGRRLDRGHTHTWTLKSAKSLCMDTAFYRLQRFDLPELHSSDDQLGASRPTEMSFSSNEPRTG